MGSKRLDWIDIAKGIAMILVIVGHTVPNPSPLRHAIFSFRMPVFFILAGYTFRPKPWRFGVAPAGAVCGSCTGVAGADVLDERRSFDERYAGCGA